MPPESVPGPGSESESLEGSSSGPGGSHVVPLARPTGRASASKMESYNLNIYLLLITIFADCDCFILSSALSSFKFLSTANQIRFWIGRFDCRHAIARNFLVMRTGSSSKRWLHEHVTDKWVKDAQKDGYRSRAAYKLLQLNEQDELLRPGMTVLDLGSTPGSWSQVAVKAVGSTGTVIATDILEMQHLPGCVFLQGDFMEEAVRSQLSALLAGRRADVMLSDMAPNLSGVALVDQGRAYNLVELALFMADAWLRTGGSAAIKVFQGNGYNECLQTMREKFRCAAFRVPSSCLFRSFLPSKLLTDPRETRVARADRVPANVNSPAFPYSPSRRRASMRTAGYEFRVGGDGGGRMHRG